MLLSYYLILFMLGLVFGSFVSAISWRIPRGISFVKGRSVCPNCRKEIRWYDNIPLFSFVILGGKCRNCKSKISLRYPVIELAAGIGFVALLYFPPTFKGLTLQGVYSVGATATLAFYLVIFLILLTIFVIDLEQQIIPDSLVFFGTGLVVLFLLFTNSSLLFPVLLSGFLASSFLLLIHLITKGKGMGLGDVKFAILGGAIVGLKLMPVWLLLSFLTGAVVGIILIVFKRAKMKTKIAFGPFLIIAIGLTLIFGDNIMKLLGFL